MRAKYASAAEAMGRRVHERAPHAELGGFSVQQMVQRPRALETIVGAAVDPIFGPVILFGHGGVAVEVIADRAVALPPLNLALAKDLVSRTRIARLLDGYRDRPPADREALYLTLTKVSQLIADLPELIELDINPLLIDECGVIALDARMRVSLPPDIGRRAARDSALSSGIEERIDYSDARSCCARSGRKTSRSTHDSSSRRRAQRLAATFLSCRARFRTLAARALHTNRLRPRNGVHCDLRAENGTSEETVGVVRAICDPDGARAEFAILVRSDMQGKGLGALLMDKIVRYCRSRGIGELVGDVLATNARMLDPWPVNLASQG